MAESIYKICSRSEWQQAVAAGIYEGSMVDRADRFIHFSTGQQLRETARKHFAGQTNLVLITVDPEPLGDALKWEPSRGGDLFPHLYDQLPTALAASVIELPWVDGRHHFPTGIAD